MTDDDRMDVLALFEAAEKRLHSEMDRMRTDILDRLDQVQTRIDGVAERLKAAACKP